MDQGRRRVPLSGEGQPTDTVPGRQPDPPQIDVSSSAGDDKRSSLLAKVMGSPFIGFVPWILLSLIEGPARLPVAVGVALALAAAFVVIDVARGRRLKSLGLFDVGAFSIFLAVALLASPPVLAWMEIWFGELANLALALLVVGSLVLRRPFTLAYAKEETPEEYWGSPMFLSINYHITAVWGAAMLVASAAGFYGDAVLHDANNVWTGWIIQLAASVVAGQFTGWYPEYATARNLKAAGQPSDEAPPATDFLGTLALDAAAIGLLMLLLHTGATWVGVTVLVLGAAGALWCRRRRARSD